MRMDGCRADPFTAFRAGFWVDLGWGKPRPEVSTLFVLLFRGEVPTRYDEAAEFQIVALSLGPLREGLGF